MLARHSPAVADAVGQTRSASASLASPAAAAVAAAAFAVRPRQKRPSRSQRRLYSWTKPQACTACRCASAGDVLEPSSRYADLQLEEDALISGGNHVLVAYAMKPAPGYDYVTTAARFAAESSTGIGVGSRIADDDALRARDAVVYSVDPDAREMRIAYPVALFDRNITDGRANLCSVLRITVGDSESMRDVEFAHVRDVYFPPMYLHLFDGPSANIADWWRLLGRDLTHGGLVIGAVINPAPGMQPEAFAEACSDFWRTGDLVVSDFLRGDQASGHVHDYLPGVAEAMTLCVKSQGTAKLLSAKVTGDDPEEVVARARRVLGHLGPLAENCGLLVDGYVGGIAAVTAVRRSFPEQFLHYRCLDATPTPQGRRGYTDFVRAKIARVMGASGVDVSTRCFAEGDGHADGQQLVRMLQADEADGPCYRQDWDGMRPASPVISGNMNALRLLELFVKLGHTDVILLVGSGSTGHKDGFKVCAASCRQAAEVWSMWRTGVFKQVYEEDLSFAEAVIEFARMHTELRGAFVSFQEDADRVFPGWREQLGEAVASELGAASPDWPSSPPP